LAIGSLDGVTLVACGGEAAPNRTGRTGYGATRIGCASGSGRRCSAAAGRFQEGEILPTPTLASDSGEVAEGESAPVEEMVSPWPADRFGYGIQIHGNATVGDPAATMQAVGDQLGMDWVKAQIQWWLVEPGSGRISGSFYDAVIDQAHL
jgi:hypothetical protein